MFSPDGRWLAYASNESGRSKVYVRAFPGPGAPWQVSTSGGWAPAWSQQAITERPGPRPFDLHPDGNRLVVSGDPTERTKVDRIVLISNFFDEVRRRLAGAGR